MYADPRHLKNKETKVRLDEKTDDLLFSMANFLGREKAALARDLLEDSLNRLIAEVNTDHEVA